MKYKRLSTAAVFLGAFIGAGFASGREIALYFADCSPLVPFLGGLLLAVFCYFFLLIGSYTHGNPKLLWGKASKFADAVIKISNLVTLCSMIAASEITVFTLFSFHGGGVITGILALITVVAGVEKIKLSNFIIVPVIILLIATLFFKNGELFFVGKVTVLPAFSYCTMNIIGGGYLVSTMSKGFSKKDCVITASYSGIFIIILIMAVFFTIRNTQNSDMPLIEAAKLSNLALIGNVVMYLAVFTTITSCLSIVSENKPYAVAIVTSLSFVVSVLGFRTIVDKLYPVLSILGAMVSTGYVFLFVMKKRRKISFTPLEKTVFRKTLTL